MNLGTVEHHPGSLVDLKSERVRLQAPAAALRLLGGPKAASSAAAQLLETLVTSAEVRDLASGQHLVFADVIVPTGFGARRILGFLVG